MKFIVSTAIVTFVATASAAVADVEGVAGLPRAMALFGRQNGANQGRPVPSAACCVAGASLKQDVCNVNGQSGRCVPDSINNCGAALTCIEDNRLTCDPSTLERGRPFCRRTGA